MGKRRADRPKRRFNTLAGEGSPPKRQRTPDNENESFMVDADSEDAESYETSLPSRQRTPDIADRVRPDTDSEESEDADSHEISQERHRRPDSKMEALRIQPKPDTDSEDSEDAGSYKISPQKRYRTIDDEITELIIQQKRSLKKADVEMCSCRKPDIRSGIGCCMCCGKAITLKEEKIISAEWIPASGDGATYTDSEDNASSELYSPLKEEGRERLRARLRARADRLSISSDDDAEDEAIAAESSMGRAKGEPVKAYERASTPTPRSRAYSRVPKFPLMGRSLEYGSADDEVVVTGERPVRSKKKFIQFGARHEITEDSSSDDGALTGRRERADDWGTMLVDGGFVDPEALRAWKSESKAARGFPLGQLPSRDDGSVTTSGYGNLPASLPWTSFPITTSNTQPPPQPQPQPQPDSKSTMPSKTQNKQLQLLGRDIAQTARQEQANGVAPNFEGLFERIRKLRHLELNEGMMEVLHALFNTPDRVRQLQGCLSQGNYIEFTMYVRKVETDASPPPILEEAFRVISLAAENRNRESAGPSDTEIGNTENKARGGGWFSNPKEKALPGNDDSDTTEAAMESLAAEFGTYERAELLKGKLSDANYESFWAYMWATRWHAEFAPSPSEEPELYEGFGLLVDGAKPEDNASGDYEAEDSGTDAGKPESTTSTLQSSQTSDLRPTAAEFVPRHIDDYFKPGEKMSIGSDRLRAVREQLERERAERERAEREQAARDLADRARPKFHKFMHLPPELRERIFEHALCVGHGIYPHLCDENRDTSRPIKFHDDARKHPARHITDLLGVTRVSKQIRAESLPCFYSANTFVVTHDTATYFTRLEHLGRFHMIRHVRFGIRMRFEKYASDTAQHVKKYLREVTEYEAANPRADEAESTQLYEWYKGHPNHVAGGLDILSEMICLLMLTSRFTSYTTGTTNKLVLPVPSADIFQQYHTLRWFPKVLKGLGIHVHFAEGHELSYNHGHMIGITWRQQFQKKDFRQKVEKGDVKKKILELWPEVEGEAETGGSMGYYRRSCERERGIEWFKVFH